MPTTSQLRFAFADPVLTGPNALDRNAMKVLGRLSRGQAEVWHSTETIAVMLGVTVRAAQMRIERLIKLGLLERVWDYGKSTRRRLVILWRKAKTYVESVNEGSFGDERRVLRSPECAPPISALSELKEEKVEGGCAAEPPPPIDVTFPEPAPEPGPVPAREHEPSEVAAKAKRAAPDHPGFAGWCLNAGRKWGFPFVSAALDVLIRRSETMTIHSPPGFVSKVVSDLKVEGLPPSAEEVDANYRARLRRVAEEAMRLDPSLRGAPTP